MSKQLMLLVLLLSSGFGAQSLRADPPLSMDELSKGAKSQAPMKLPATHGLDGVREFGELLRVENKSYPKLILVFQSKKAGKSIPDETIQVLLNEHGEPDAIKVDKAVGSHTKVLAQITLKGNKGLNELRNQLTDIGSRQVDIETRARTQNADKQAPPTH